MSVSVSLDLLSFIAGQGRVSSVVSSGKLNFTFIIKQSRLSFKIRQAGFQEFQSKTRWIKFQS